MFHTGILDPRLFISESEAKSFSINTVEEKDENLSACEKTWTTKADGTVVCKCPKRAKPGPYNKKEFEEIFDEIEKEVKKEGQIYQTTSKNI